MITGFQHLHSVNRYILLALLLIVIISSFQKWKGNKEYTKQDDKLNLITFIITHLQLLIGMILYYSSYVNNGLVQFNGDTMANKIIRFFTVEHFLGMLIAIALITVARIKGKKIVEGVKRHKMTFWYYLIALIIIFASIPWPFRNVGVMEWF